MLASRLSPLELHLRGPSCFPPGLIGPLLRHPSVNDLVRGHWRRSVVPIAVVIEVDLPDAFLHALDKIVEQTQAIWIRRLAVGDASQWHGTIIQQEANVRC